MTIEEKAKRYDEVSQEVKGFFEDKQKMPFDVDKTLEYLFPELKDSEDEKIRKNLIGFLTTISSLKDGQTLSNKDFDSKVILDWAAWLERKDNNTNKIGQKPNYCHHEVDLSNCSEEYRKAYYDGWNNCNIQYTQLKKEQKSNPYSGVSFEYNGHTWGMCARDGGVEIAYDKQLIASINPIREKNKFDNFSKVADDNPIGGYTEDFIMCTAPNHDI